MAGSHPRRSGARRGSRRSQWNESGFTLIELLVVIIIIGILAAIAIPVFLNQRRKGYEASEESDLHTVAYEIESYYATTDDYTAVPFGSVSGASTKPTVSGSGVNVGGDSMSLSKGNTAQLLAAGVNGYCVAMTNNLGSGIATWYFDSLGGGLTKTACPQVGKTY